MKIKLTCSFGDWLDSDSGSQSESEGVCRTFPYTSARTDSSRTSSCSLRIASASRFSAAAAAAFSALVLSPAPGAGEDFPEAAGEDFPLVLADFEPDAVEAAMALLAAALFPASALSDGVSFFSFAGAAAGAAGFLSEDPPMLRTI